MKRMMLVVAATLFASIAAHAQVTKPVQYTWIVSSCQTWNCAAGALVLAGGDKYVIALPTGQETRPWLILKRVEEGSIYIPDDEPYGCDVFANVAEAGAAFAAIDACRAPLILNVPDGRAVVVSLGKCTGSTAKQRAIR